MSTNPAGRRGRRAGAVSGMPDQVLEIAFAADQDDGFPPDAIEDRSLLARGIVWSKVVAEMERDRRIARPEAA